MAIDIEERKKYFRDYYKRNKLAISAKRSKRWREDAEYRERQQKARNEREAQPHRRAHRVKRYRENRDAKKLARLMGISLTEAKEMIAEMDRERADKAVALAARKSRGTNVGVYDPIRGAVIVAGVVGRHDKDSGKGAGT